MSYVLHYFWRVHVYVLLTWSNKQASLFPNRYWKELNPTKNTNAPLGEWTTDAWEAFMLLGAPGFNEPHLLPIASGGRAGTSGLPSRAATKRRAKESAQQRAAKQPCGAALDGGDAGGLSDVNNGSGSAPFSTPKSSVGTPSSGPPPDFDSAAFHGTMLAVQSEIVEQTHILKEIAASEREKLKLKKKNNMLAQLKVQLDYLPAGSPAHQQALARLESLFDNGDEVEEGVNQLG